ncbi:MAG: extracellular solute-binding protein [Inquilinus sp.]|nr:extracellular solute-binding protein [Inquilinus sp.]
MKKLFLAGAALVAGAAMAPAMAQDVVLNVATAGSENMVDYVIDYLGPMFEETHPGVRVNVVGTGPGDAGSQAIFEKLSAQSAAGAAAWDIDVAVVHQKMGGNLVREGLLASYRDQVETGALVTSAAADNALGTDVSGYVIPMFHSQTAIAYNPLLVADAPATYADLVEWTTAHPRQFGYNGIKGGMSGVSFYMGWLYAMTDDAGQMMAGPYDASVAEGWSDALDGLKAFNENVTFTPGNAGTLDMLNRGEIAMGPVWVDMFYTWQADGRLSPDLKLKLIGPGMPGQPMYYVTPAKATNPDLAREFIELATSPQVQAEGIVQRFNWYPGIDASHIEDFMSPDAWAKLFADVTPEDLAANGKTFPIAEFFDLALENYERHVAQ